MAIWAILCAFVSDSVSRFIYESIRRVLARISGRFWARLLAIQLVVLLPWTTLLAVANGEAWFGDESIKWAWVTFNALLGISLMALTRLLWIQHPIARRMSMFLAGATMTDAVLSTAQAVQLHSAVQGWAAFFVFLGVTGPCVATAFLWCIAIASPSTGQVGRGIHEIGTRISTPMDLRVKPMAPRQFSDAAAQRGSRRPLHVESR